MVSILILAFMKVSAAWGSLCKEDSLPETWVITWIFLVVVAELLNYLYLHEKNACLHVVIETFLLISRSVCFFLQQKSQGHLLFQACNKCLLVSGLKDLLLFSNPKVRFSKGISVFHQGIVCLCLLDNDSANQNICILIEKLSTCIEWLIKNIFWSWGDLKISFSYFHFFLAPQDNFRVGRLP